jgi:6-phosphogluconolactonase (cycloisomerase 2 family)
MADLIPMLAAVAGQSGGDQGNAWDLDFASFQGILYSAGLTSLVGAGGSRGLTFKPDGTKMYITGVNADAVREFDLSTAYQPSTASVVNTFSVAGQASQPQDVQFKPDGTKMYVIDAVSDNIYQYSLSTAWDVSTATYDSVSYNVIAEEVTATGLEWKPDGTKFYIIGETGDEVNEYDLSVAWDLSTVTFVQNFSVSAEAGATPSKVRFKPDGTKMYVSSRTANNSVYEYDLSTAWNISTASYNSVSYNINTVTGGTQPSGMAFNDTGTALFLICEITANQRIFGFPLESAWDLSTANSRYRFVGAEETGPRSVTFKSDGTEMYVLGTTGDDVNQYSVSTAWSLQSVSYTQAFVVSGQTGALPVKVQFKDDGTKMYVLSNTNDAIYQYSLSTAWDVSTATYDSVSFSVNSQEATPEGMFFGDSGTKLYVVGTTNDTVYQYTLSSAWDLSTASYASKSFSVTSRENTPNAVFIGNNGTAMYIIGTQNDRVDQYTLSTAWDVSTASYASKTFSISSYEATPRAVWFKGDGTSFYVTGETNDIVWEFTIS